MPRVPNPSGGPATGAGWGGPAKGAGRVIPGQRVTIAGGKGDPDKMAARVIQKQLDAVNAQKIKDHLLVLSTTAKEETAQIRASEAWLNRIEGMPVQRAIVATSDFSEMTEKQLDAEIRRLRRLEAGMRG